MKIQAVVAIFAFSACAAATHAQIILVDHQPHPYGGGASDTLFITSLGQTFWQRHTDDFTLGQTETITNFNAWGFYDHDVAPTSETMRIRFYRSRAGDGLPDDGNIVYEESYSNLSRVATGRHIFDDYFPREFFYQANLATPVSFDAGTKYWFEFVQIGDVSTHFRWEDSVSDPNGYAFINPVTVDWRSSLPNGTYGTAFQLWSIPEPIALQSFLLAALLAIRTKTGGERRRPCNKHA